MINFTDITAKVINFSFFSNYSIVIIVIMGLLLNTATFFILKSSDLTRISSFAILSLYLMVIFDRINI